MIKIEPLTAKERKIGVNNNIETIVYASLMLFYLIMLSILFYSFDKNYKILLLSIPAFLFLLIYIVHTNQKSKRDEAHDFKYILEGDIIKLEKREGNRKTLPTIYIVVVHSNFPTRNYRFEISKIDYERLILNNKIKISFLPESKVILNIEIIN